MTLATAVRSAAIGSMLVLGACAAEREAGREIVWDTERVEPSTTAPAAAGAGAGNAPGLDADGCREYTQTIRIGDEEHQAFGRACLQPDGSWRIHPPANGPAAGQAVPAPAATAVPAYPYYYAPPAFFGSAFFFSHHHHRHKHHHHGYRHRHGHRR
jgi:hypothetical protein